MICEFSENVGRNNRILWLDAIKALAAYFVCFYHLTAYNRNVNYGSFVDGVYIPTIEKFFYGVLVSSVPLFFVASGFTLLLKPRTLRKNIVSAVRLVLICVVCGFFCNVVLKSIAQRAFVVSWSFLIQQPHYFWYFYTLASIYVFDIVWKKIKNNLVRKSVFYGLVVFPFFSNFIWDIIIAYNPKYNLPQWGHIGFFRMYSLVYILIPQFWTKRIPVLRCILTMIIGLLLILFEVYAFSTHDGVIYDGVNSSFPTLGALCITWSIFCIIRSFHFEKKRISHFVSWLGKNCLGIYILHYLFVELLRIFTPILESGWSIQIIMTFLIIVLSACISDGFSLLYKKCVSVFSSSTSKD